MSQLLPRRRTRVNSRIISHPLLRRILNTSFKKLFRIAMDKFVIWDQCMLYDSSSSSAKMLTALICHGSIIVYWILEKFTGLRIKKSHIQTYYQDTAQKHHIPQIFWIVELMSRLERMFILIPLEGAYYVRGQERE